MVVLRIGPESQRGSIATSGLMEWTDDGGYLCLTKSGEDEFESFILSAEEASV